MPLEIPSDIQPIVANAIASGRCTDEQDVLRQALRLYEQFEQRRESLRLEIDKGVQSGESIAGEVVSKELESLARELAAKKL